MIRSLNVKILIVCVLIVIISMKVSINPGVEVFNEQDILKYYPTEEMVKVFKDEYGNIGFIQIVDRIESGKVQIKQIDKTASVVMIYEITKDYIKLIYTEEIMNDQLKNHYIDDLTPNRNDYIIKTPIQKGTKWHDNIGGEYEIIKTNAVVETDIGDFETIVVRYKNDEFTVKEYYSKDMGLVRIVVNNFTGFQLEEVKESGDIF